MATKNKLPDIVYVLGHEYSIEEMSKNLFKEREAYGDCDNEQRKIRIYCGVSNSVVRDTLLHEILHAAWNLLYLDNEKEEKIVSRLATLLVGFFDDPRNLRVKNFILLGAQQE